MVYDDGECGCFVFDLFDFDVVLVLVGEVEIILYCLEVLIGVFMVLWGF